MKLVRKSAMRRINNLIKDMENGYIEIEDFEKKLTSMIGHAKHADTYNMICNIKDRAEAAKTK